MVYNFETIDQLESVLINANIITKYKTTTELIFSAPNYTNKIVRVSAPSSGTAGIYMGDSWTSGTTLVNSMQIAAAGNSLAPGSTVVITPTVLFIMYITASARKLSVLFSRLNNSNRDFIAIPSVANTDPTMTSTPKNTTQGTDAKLILHTVLPLQTSNGFYYQQDVKMAMNGVLDPSVSLTDVKWLTKLGSASSMVNTYGNDVGVYVPYINGNYYGGEALIKNGAI